MHIPESFISPATSAVTGAAMLPVWGIAARRVRDTLGMRQVPLLAMGAAFSFVAMMFNVPAIGPTTTHAYAGTLIAVILGPWAAVIAISAALAIQALFFGDGGLLTFGANCFCMAFAGNFVGYSAYRLLAGRSDRNAPWRAVAAGIGAYVGINLAAVLVAILLGIQPALHRGPGGEAVYFPFGLKVTLPALLLAHLLIAGPLEAVITGLVARYFQAARLPLYGAGAAGTAQPEARGWRREGLWIGLLALIALSPLGLLAQGDAWGEWDAEGMRAEIAKREGRGYVPAAVQKQEESGFKGAGGLSDYAGEHGAPGYIASALLGVGLLAALMLIGGRFLAHREKEDGGDGPQPPGGDAPRPGQVPDWMRRASDDSAPPSPGGKTNPFVERTLAEFATGGAATLAGERWAREPGYLQRLDARAKILGVFALLLAAALARHPLTLLGLMLLALLLSAASRVPPGLLLRRACLAVGLFVGVPALFAALSPAAPGRPLLVLWRAPFLAVTEPGSLVAATLLLRAGAAVSLAMLLTLTTRWSDLLHGLRALGTPRLFVAVLAMTYRYLLTLMQAAAEMFAARRSRTVGRASNAQGRQFVGASLGALFGRTLALSEEVYAAMLARGFQGEMRTLTVSRWRAAESAWMAGALLIALAALGGEHVRLLP